MYKQLIIKRYQRFARFAFYIYKYKIKGNLICGVTKINIKTDNTTPLEIFIVIK